MVVVIAVAVIILLAGLAENMLHRRNLKKIPLRILVNGTRGKTTVTRMAIAVLNEAGIRTMGKTTGSEARRIFPDGREEEYRQERRPVNMIEQLPFLRMAVKEKVQAIVVECMAQRPENQRVLARQLIRPHFVLMTNAYVDHIEEIGATEEETVAVLAQSITDECAVITEDSRFSAYTNRLLMSQRQVDTTPYQGCNFPIHEENLRLVAELARQLNIDEDTFRRGILKTRPDIGMFKEVMLAGCRIRNAFAANDPNSFRNVLEETSREGPYALIYNHRSDRSYRLEAFAQVLRTCSHPPTEIGVIGDAREWCAKYLRRVTGIVAIAVTQPISYAKEHPNLLCAGNIKGDGRMFLQEAIKEAYNDV